MRLEPFTGTLTEPLNVADAKLYLRVDGTDDDALIAVLITAAREHIEKATGELLVSRTLVGVADRWPGVEDVGPGLVSPRGIPFADGLNDPVPPPTAGTLELPVRPVTVVSKIEIVDNAGTASGFDAANWYLDTSGQAARIALRPGAVVPADRQVLGGIRVTFTAGWATPPADLMLALRQILTHWYENRQAVVTGTIASEVPLGAARILKSHKQVRL